MWEEQLISTAHPGFRGGGGEGAATYYSPNFPENCMEIKELELSLGARPRFVYVDLQLRYCFCRNTL